MVESTQEHMQKFVEAVKSGGLLKEIRELAEDPDAQQTLVEAAEQVKPDNVIEGIRIETELADERREYFLQRCRDLESELEEKKLQIAGLKQRVEIRETDNRYLTAKIKDLEKDLTEKSEREMAKEHEELLAMGARGIELYQKTKDPMGMLLAVEAMDQMDEDPDERPGWIFLDKLNSYVIKKLRELPALGEKK